MQQWQQCKDQLVARFRRLQQLGQGRHHDYWLNESISWVVCRVSRGVGSAAQRELLTQAGRELLLAQSSDWSFILRAGTTTDLAKEPIERHLDRFWRLMDAINNTPLPYGWLEAVEREDALFPLLNPSDWASRP